MRTTTTAFLGTSSLAFSVPSSIRSRRGVGLPPRACSNTPQDETPGTSSSKPPKSKAIPSLRQSRLPKFLSPFVQTDPKLVIEYNSRPLKVNLESILRLYVDLKVPLHFTDLVAEAWIHGDLGRWSKLQRARMTSVNLRREWTELMDMEKAMDDMFLREASDEEGNDSAGGARADDIDFTEIMVAIFIGFVIAVILTQIPDQDFLG